MDTQPAFAPREKPRQRKHKAKCKGTVISRFPKKETPSLASRKQSKIQKKRKSDTRPQAGVRGSFPVTWTPAPAWNHDNNALLRRSGSTSTRPDATRNPQQATNTRDASAKRFLCRIAASLDRSIPTTLSRKKERLRPSFFDLWPSRRHALRTPEGTVHTRARQLEQKRLRPRIPSPSPHSSTPEQHPQDPSRMSTSSISPRSVAQSSRPSPHVNATRPRGVRVRPPQTHASLFPLFTKKLAKTLHANNIEHRSGKRETNKRKDKTHLSKQCIHFLRSLRCPPTSNMWILS
jgi:hypothetical protein